MGEYGALIWIVLVWTVRIGSYCVSYRVKRDCDPRALELANRVAFINRVLLYTRPIICFGPKKFL